MSNFTRSLDLVPRCSFFFFFGYFDRWNLWLSKKSGGNSVKFCKEKPSIDFFLHKKIISREKYEFVISSW